MGCGASADAPSPTPREKKRPNKVPRGQHSKALGTDSNSVDDNVTPPPPHPFVVDEVVSQAEAPPNARHVSSTPSLSDISDTDLGGMERSGHGASAAASHVPPPVGWQPKSLEAQRHEADVDMQMEFFVWDDASLDLREMRTKQNARKQMAAARDKNVLARRPIDRSSGASMFIFNDFMIEDSATLEALSESVRGVNPMLKHNREPSIHPSVGRRESRVLPRNPGDIRDFSLTSRIGHSNRVKCLSIAPGEREYVSCSNDDSIVTYYDVRTAQELGIFSGHQDTVIHATFSPCGKFLATTSRDNTLILWDVVTQKAVLTFEHGKVVICCAFSKTSRFIATGCQDKVCRLWECRRGKELVAFSQHEGIIISMSISPDESYVCSASADKTLRIWTANKGRPKAVLKGHSHIILACNYTTDGSRILSNDERAVRVWTAPAGQCLRVISVDDLSKKKSFPVVANKKMSWTLSCLAPKTFPRHFIVASNNRMVFVMDMDTGEETLSVDTKAPVYCLAAGYRNLVTFGDSFGNVYFLRLETFDDDDVPAVDERPGGADWV